MISDQSALVLEIVLRHIRDKCAAQQALDLEPAICPFRRNYVSTIALEALDLELAVRASSSPDDFEALYLKAWSSKELFYEAASAASSYTPKLRLLNSWQACYELERSMYAASLDTIVKLAVQQMMTAPTELMDVSARRLEPKKAQMLPLEVVVHQNNHVKQLKPEQFSALPLLVFRAGVHRIGHSFRAAYAHHGFTQMRYCFAPESWQLHHGFIAIGYAYFADGAAAYHTIPCQSRFARLMPAVCCSKTNVSEQELQDFMMTRLHMRQEEMNTGKKFKTEHKTKRNNKRKQRPG